MSHKEYFKLIPAVYLVLRRDDDVLLLRRANTGYQDGNYSVVAGHLDGDEVATQGLIREAKEEAGITVNTQDIKLVHTAHRLTRNQPGNERLDLFFEVRNWQGEVTNMEPHKCDELAWYPLANLPANMIPFVRRVLTDISNGVYYSEYETEPLE